VSKALKYSLIFFLYVGLAGNILAADEADLRLGKMSDLGAALFFDVNLSQARTQSCATCHDPARAFTDWRDSGVSAAASLGGDLLSLGDRNAPTISYAALTPEFHINAEGKFKGGMFLDGREAKSYRNGFSK
jgi:cytochrome c peroxidase